MQSINQKVSSHRKRIANRMFSGTRGQGMVEFAITIPVLLLLMLIIVELGHVLFYFGSVYAAAREAARYGAAVDKADGTNKYLDQPGMKAAAKRIGFITGLTDDQIDIQYDCGVGSTKTTTVPICAEGKMFRVSVQVNTTYVPIVPLPPVPPFPISSTIVRSIVQDVGLPGDYPTRIPPTPVPPPDCGILANLGPVTGAEDPLRLDTTTYPRWTVLKVTGDPWMIMTFLNVDSKPPSPIKLEKVLVDPTLPSSAPYPAPPTGYDPESVDNNIRWSGLDASVKISLGGSRVGTGDHYIYLKFAPGVYKADITIETSCPSSTWKTSTVTGGVP
jgi:Flp pilus assembly protein TadG